MRQLSRILLVFACLFAFSAAAAEQPPIRLRVLTYNIAHGRGMDDKVDLQRAAEVIAAVKPDLVALQEVDVHTKRTAGADQATDLAKQLQMQSVFGKAMDYQGGQYGVAILSRYPLSGARVTALPFVRGRTEPRALLTAQVKVPGLKEPLLFACTHLEVSDDAVQFREATLITQALAKVGTPLVILGGDMNAKPGSPTIELLSRSLVSATPVTDLTYSAKEPKIKIDWIFYRSTPLIRVMQSKVIDAPLASDHRPLLVEFEIKP